MSSSRVLRSHLADLLTWSSAHADFDRAVKNVPPEARGERPHTVPYSLWQLLEHIRTAQRDILDFCRNSDYRSPDWPNDFWPDDPEPPSREDWQKSIDAVHRDRYALVELIEDESTDLFKRIPHGEDQTLLREVVLVADHNAYHVGQMVLLRRLLGIWPP